MNAQIPPFMQSNQIPQFNESQFRQMLPRINDQMLNQAAQMARQMGFSEQQINEGISLIQKMR